MIKRSWNKPRLLGLLVTIAVVYIFVFFCWWAYSLLNYNKLQLENEKNTMEIERQLIMPHIIKRAKAGDFESENSLPLMYKKDILLIDSSLVKEYFNANFKEKHALSFNSSTVLLEFVDVKNCPEHYEYINKEYEGRRKAFVGEAIFFLFIGGLLAFFILYNLREIIRLSRMQSNFVLAVTHELNTPLATIRIAAQTLNRKGGALKGETKAKFINKIVTNVDRLSALINNILDVTKHDLKKFTLDMKSINLKDVMVKQHELLTNLYPDKEIEFELNINETESISGDINLLSLVFSNILSNAVKYSHESVKIVVESKSDNKFCNIWFKDDGIGIPQSEQDFIFRKFYRIGEENTRIAKGTGLGLFIVKRILNRHGAKIKVLSDGIKGTTFELIFKK